MQRYNIIQLLESQEANDFIINHLSDDISSLALRFAGKVSFDLSEALKLMAIYQKARKKLPSFVENRLALTDRSYQQATSEQVAKYKANFIRGERLLDLTAGLGVDDLAFARHFDEVIAVDTDENLNAMAEFNFRKLGVTNIERRTADAEIPLDEAVDWLYIDPDRRSEGGRHVGIDQMKPQVRTLIPHYLSLGCKIALKLSPLFEIKEIRSVFPECNAVHVISEKGEVKEVLALFLNTEEFIIYAVDLGPRGFAFSAGPEQWGHPIDIATELGHVLYIPNSALIKSRLTDYFMSELGFQRCGDFAIYQATEAQMVVGCKTMEVVDRCSSGIKSIKKMIKRSTGKQFNIIAKGSSNKASYYAQKLGIKEGGNDYLVILQGAVNQACICKLLF